MHVVFILCSLDHSLQQLPFLPSPLIEGSIDVNLVSDYESLETKHFYSCHLINIIVKTTYGEGLLSRFACFLSIFHFFIQRLTSNRFHFVRFTIILLIVIYLILQSINSFHSLWILKGMSNQSSHRNCQSCSDHHSFHIETYWTIGKMKTCSTWTSKCILKEIEMIFDFKINNSPLTWFIFNIYESFFYMIIVNRMIVCFSFHMFV